MNMMEELQFMTSKGKDTIDHCIQCKKFLDSYQKKVADIELNLKQNRHASDFRKKFYKAQKLVSRVHSIVYDLMLELEMTNPFVEDEEDSDIIEVPCLPSMDGEFQNYQFEMQFLHGTSPWNFWLAHCEENVTRRLGELLQKKVGEVEKLVEEPIIGDFVLYMQGSTLRRAMILKYLSFKMYQIIDIDNGNTTVFPLQRLYKMDEEISLIPYQAVNCSLFKDPEESSMWNNDVESLFLGLLNRCKLTVKIIEKKSGSLTCFYVKIKAKDSDETERSVDVGKWITDRVLPGLKSGGILDADCLDPFFYEDCDYDSSDSSKDRSDDNSSQTCSTSPIIELPNDDNEQVVSRIPESNNNISKDLVPVRPQLPTASNPGAFNQAAATNMIITPPSSKIAANFNELTISGPPPTNNMMAGYQQPLMPISPTAGLMRGYPMMPRHPHPSPYIGYPLTQSVSNVTRVSGYPTNQGPPPIRYPIATTPNPSQGMPPSNQWSTNDFNTVNNQSYESPKCELKTPIVLVRPNEELRASCSYIVSPNEFYVHLANKNNVKIDLLGEDLEKYYSACKSRYYQLRPGAKYCACKYIWQDNYCEAPLTTWFRAEVISMQGNEAFVFLVDYGIKLRKNVNELRVLDKRFFVYDKMAQRCHLHGVPIVESEYSKDVTDHFKSLIESKERSQQLNISVFNNVQTQACSLSVVVKLLGRDGTVNEDVKNFIKEKETISTEENDWNPMSEDYYADTNRLDHVIDNPLMATCGFIPKDDEKLCRFYAQTGRCPKKACRQEHVFMGEDVFTVDRVETFAQTIGKQKLPELGSRIKVKVLKNACIAHKRFYGQWLYANEYDKNSIKDGKYKYDDDDEYYDDEEEETLKTLMDALNMANNTQKYRPAEHPAIGEMVIVKVVEDDHGSVWYRAQVTEVHELYCLVFLIDFGVTKPVSMRRMRAMEPRFLHLPPQATEFCVAGVEVIESQWDAGEPPTSIISKWEDTVLDAYVIKRYHGSVEVNLWDGNGKSIRRKLAETGKYTIVDQTFGVDSGPMPG